MSGTSEIDHLLFVLGMHRSGTSALAGALVRGGFTVPGEDLPGNDDNPDGYFEARKLVDIDNHVLKRLNSSWHDEGPPPVLESVDDHAAAAELLAEWSRASPRNARIVAKDPRLCRLLPLWRTAAAETRIPHSALLIARPLREVQLSLFRRASNPAFRPAAMLDPDRVALLWLRYVTEAELHSRGLRRACLSYRQMLAAPGAMLQQALDTLAIPGSFDFEAALAGLHEPRAGKPGEAPPPASPEIDALCQRLYETIDRAQGKDLDVSACVQFDSTREALQAIDQRFGSLYRPALEAPAASPFSRSMARATADQELCRRSASDLRGCVLLVADDDSTRGYRYRVENRIEALERFGITAKLASSAAESWSAELDGAALVLVHRALESEGLDQLYRQCGDRAVPIGYDIDDLLFDASLMTPEHFAYLQRPEVAVVEWQERARAHRRLLERSDFGLFSTEVLAEAARSLVKRSDVVANGLSHERLERASVLRMTAQTSPTRKPGLVVGYASGTPTHQRDFATIVQPLAQVLEKHPSARLVVVGYLDLEPFGPLAAFADRIEQRPVVPFDQLPDELARFDINLAPLEIGNALTEAKSELKYFEAGLVSVPTVASATAPMSAAIRHHDTGFLAESEQEWFDAIDQLVADHELRREVGQRAHLHAIADFGPVTQANRFVAALIRVLGQASGG